DALERDLRERAQLCARPEPQLQPRRAHTQACQRVREECIEVTFADDVETELAVQLSRPILRECLEVDEVTRALRLVECVLHDGAAEAATAETFDRVHVLDLGDST